MSAPDDVSEIEQRDPTTDSLETSGTSIENAPSGPYRNAVYVFRTANFDLGPGIEQRIERVNPEELTDGFPLEDLLKDIDEIDKKLGSHTSLSRLRNANTTVWTKDEGTSTDHEDDVSEEGSLSSYEKREIEARGLSRRQQKRAVRFHSEHEVSAAEQRKYSLRVTTGTDLTQPEQILPAPRIIKQEKGPKLFVIWSRKAEQKEKAGRIIMHRRNSDGTLWTSYEDLALATDYQLTDDEDYIVPRDREGYAWLRPPKREDDSTEDSSAEQSMPTRVLHGIRRASASASKAFRRKSTASLSSIKSTTSISASRKKKPSRLRRCLRRMICCTTGRVEDDGKALDDIQKPEEVKKPGILKKPKGSSSSTVEKTVGLAAEPEEMNEDSSTELTTIVQTFILSGESNRGSEESEESKNNVVSENEDANTNQVAKESENVDTNDVAEESEKVDANVVTEQSDGADRNEVAQKNSEDVNKDKVSIGSTRVIKFAETENTEEPQEIKEPADAYYQDVDSDEPEHETASKSGCLKCARRHHPNQGGKSYCCIKLAIHCCGKKRHILFPRCCVCDKRLRSVLPKGDDYYNSYGEIVF